MGDLRLPIFKIISKLSGLYSRFKRDDLGINRNCIKFFHLCYHRKKPSKPCIFAPQNPPKTDCYTTARGTIT